ncbi:MAG: serine/threonine protein kinase, partial [Acidobacteria bacterium]|nr:serine/threonine protein kinase [Acidobacteriota bacterium]
LPTDSWEATDAALDRALDLEGEERQAYLSSLPEHLQRRVQELLRAAETEGPLSRDVGELAGNLLEAADFQLDPPVEGRILGPWRLLRRLGGGGMGVVYLAERDDGAFEQRVALKVIRWELADSALVQRFLAERQILAQLNHPNIASLYDGGMTEDGLPYLVLELVEGRALDRHCREEELGARRRIELLVQVARAVDFAHRRLVVHRDLKPSNILVRSDGVPKLLDFGVAKLLAGAAAKTTRFAPLTPRYAAPEQRRGDPVTVAADVWALGKLLDELLEGHRDRDLEHVLLQAMREEPERRYRSAGELADDLERYLAGHPVQAVEPTLFYRLGKWARRRRSTATALAAAVLVALLGVFGVLWQARVARLERDQARRQAQRAEQVTGFLRTLFEAAVPRLGEEPRVRDLLDRGAERIRGEMADAPLARADLLATLGESYKWLHEYDQAEALLREALSLVETQAPGSYDHAMTLAHLGGVALHRGRATDLPAAEDLFRRALQLIEGDGDGAEGGASTDPRQPAGLASLYNSMGMVFLASGRPDEALQWLRRSAEHFQRLGNDATLAMARGNLGRALDQLGRYPEGEVEHRAAADLYRRAAPSNSTRATVLSNLAMNLAAQGRLDEAISTLDGSLELRRNSSEPASALAEVKANLAYLLLVAGRAGEAARLAAGAAQVLDRETPGTTNAIACRANLGWALALEGQSERALAILHRVVEELETGFAFAPSLLARGQTRYGAALLRAGRPEEARRHLEAALKGLGPQPPSAAVLADVLLAAGSLRCDGGEVQGLDDTTRAAEIYRKLHGPGHWLTALAEVERARCLRRAGLPWNRLEIERSRSILAATRGAEAWDTLRAEELLKR